MEIAHESDYVLRSLPFYLFLRIQSIGFPFHFTRVVMKLIFFIRFLQVTEIFASLCPFNYLLTIRAVCWSNDRNYKQRISC